MRNTILTTACFFLLFVGFAQNNSERYEHATFLVSKGQSTGAVTTDFVMKAGVMDGNMIGACMEAFFSKDIVFDVEFVTDGPNEIIRVYHLEELQPEDLKILFVESANTTEFNIEPSRLYKMDTNRGE